MNMARLGRLTLGLYNSYDPKKFAEAHRRALVRAGPIALAFDSNLVTFGFPYEAELKTPEEIATWAAGTTSIGLEGEYLVELAKKGRFSAFPFVSKGFPPQFGETVITTRKPFEGRKVSPKWAANELSHGNSILLIFGLGPHGLDKKTMEIGRYHLDVTGKGYSLETCTAIGAVPSSIMAYLDSMTHDQR